MKKRIALFAAVAIMIALSGCSNSQPDSTDVPEISIEDQTTMPNTPQITTNVPETSIEDQTTTPNTPQITTQASDETVLVSCNSNFSEGLCWIVLEYKDTGVRKNAIIDKEGNIVAEYDYNSFSSFGDFYNGVSLVSTEEGLDLYINAQGEVVFSSDDPEYESLIQGMYDGGYMFLRKTDANLTSSTMYYAIINHKKEFIIDWTEYSDYDLYNYLGGGVFAFFNGYSDIGSVGAMFYNAETETWLNDRVSFRTILTQPHLVAEETNGWIMAQDGENHPIALSTKDGISYELNLEETYDMSGQYGDGVYVLVATDYKDDIAELALFDTSTGETVTIDYEYTNLIDTPDFLYVDTIYDSYAELGRWPAFNKVISLEKVHSQSHLCTLQYSKGAMLLQLNGVDGVDYYTLIDKQGNSIIEPTPGEAIGTIGNGRFIIKVDDTYHVLNEKGEEVFLNLVAEDSDFQEIWPVFDPFNDNIEVFHDGLVKFNVLSKDGIFSAANPIFVDTEGNAVFWVGETMLGKSRK